MLLLLLLKAMRQQLSHTGPSAVAPVLLYLHAEG
jgi:hypothetical protein